MKKFVVLGAGAYQFAPAILEDLIMKADEPSEIWLVDADLDLAELTARAAGKLAKARNLPCQFYYTTQWQKSIFGADAVILCSDFLDPDAWKQDLDALDEVGLGKQARLTGGIGGAMQTLRSCGFVADVAEKIALECSGETPLILCDNCFGGLVLSRACETAETFCGVPSYGISDVVGQTRARVALYLGIPQEQVEVTCGGINAFSFISSLRNRETGEDLLPRLRKEICEDDREALAAQFIDFYDAVPAGMRVTQYELLADTELSPRKTVIYSGVGLADFEVRKRDLAMLAVYGPDHPEGEKAWQHILDTGCREVRPVALVRALWGKGKLAVPAMTMRNKTSYPSVTEGRYIEGPAEVDGTGVVGIPTSLPVEITELMEQLTLCNRLMAEAAATGNRDALREALEIDPALAGVDVLYAEDVLERMMEKQKDKLPRFYGEAEEKDV